MKIMFKRTIAIIFFYAAGSVILYTCTPQIIKNSTERNNASYAGSSSCLSKCHPKKVEYSKSGQNRHKDSYIHVINSPAYKKLRKEGKEKRCWECHVTGYGRPGGFKDEKTTPELAELGCEACHGPGSKHIIVDVKDVKKKKKTIIRNPDCSGCHKMH